MAADEDREQWLAGVPLCPTTADTYDRFVEPAIFGPWADLFVNWLGVGPGDVALDVGTGTGAVAVRMGPGIGEGGRVVAIDPKLEMLRRGARAATGSAICWVQADAQSLPFGSEQFDVVACQHVLPLVADRHAALREMRRVLRRGGRLGVAVWSPIDGNPASSALADVVERYVSNDLATWYRTGPFGYGSTDALAADLATAGFVDVEVVERKLSVTFRSVPLFARVYVDGDPFIEASAATRQDLLDELEASLASYGKRGPLTYPTTAYLARASREPS